MCKASGGTNKFQISLVQLLELQETPKRTTLALRAKSWTLSKEQLHSVSPNKLTSRLLRILCYNVSEDTHKDQEVPVVVNESKVALEDLNTAPPLRSQPTLVGAAIAEPKLNKHPKRLFNFRERHHTDDELEDSDDDLNGAVSPVRHHQNPQSPQWSSTTPEPHASKASARGAEKKQRTTELQDAPTKKSRESHHG